MKTYIQYLFVLLSGFSFAQQKDSVRQKTPAFILKFTHGLNNSSEFDFSKSQWDKMTPDFQIPDSLKPGGFGYFPENKDDVYANSSDAYFMLSFGLINNKEKQAGKKYRTTTTFHLGYGPQLRATKRWLYESHEVIDTLTSSQNGSAYYLSGTRRQDLVKTYRSQSLIFGVGQHFSTNPNRIFQFETGIDLLCFMSIISEIKLSYFDSYTVDNAPQGYSYVSPTLTDPVSRDYGGKFIAGMIMRLPLDLSFKLSRNNPLLSRMRIGGELNPGMITHFTDGLITANFNLSGGINFRFQF
ncbi:hypothetical protein [Fluviicola sp.]|uniref:hypothetical protein n=1 Tax=Fluviicola sp. TaxID=1917219 RepID=UPI002607C5B6|nr:hypothetical protein [Fluviicola sp.]